LLELVFQQTGIKFSAKYKVRHSQSKSDMTCCRRKLVTINAGSNLQRLTLNSWVVKKLHHQKNFFGIEITDHDNLIFIMYIVEKNDGKKE
jgi:hypothetical protein